MSTKKAPHRKLKESGVIQGNKELPPELYRGVQRTGSDEVDTVVRHFP
ncbi:MAG: hypothetical protein AAB848_03060 [Patescibacteria group bacterium]